MALCFNDVLKVRFIILMIKQSNYKKVKNMFVGKAPKKLKVFLSQTIDFCPKMCYIIYKFGGACNEKAKCIKFN